MHLPLIILTATLAGIAGCEEQRTAVPLDKVPAAATAAAVAAVPGFTATSASSENEDGETSYELRGTASGKKAEVELEVKPDGTATVEKTEVEVALDQVPAATRDAALKAAPGLQIAGAERTTKVKKGTISWSLTGNANGKTIEVEVKADGSTKIEAEAEADDHDGKDHKD